MAGDMVSNDKLSQLIAGRTIAGTGNANDEMTIHFTDKSRMTVRTAGSTNSASTGGAVKAVRQSAATLDLEFTSGAILSIPLAEGPSLVAVHDAQGTLEYAD